MIRRVQISSFVLERANERFGLPVRSYTIVDPFFGAVVFTAVLLDDGTVEVADFDTDPDYWTTINADPDE